MGNLLKIVLILVVAGVAAARASNLDTVGVTLLRTVTTNVNGTGVRVGQVEAGYGAATNWQVNPGVVGQPTGLFTYVYGTSPYLFVSSSSTYPNSLGGESGHADTVAGNYFGTFVGVATNVVHVDNYEVNTFINYYISDGHTIFDRIVNQSFTYGSYDTSVDQIYDDYAALNGVLFVTGAGFNFQPVYTPATAYNGIGVGVANDASSPYGPTPDGRSKPDIVAPGVPPDTVTSYTTPLVAGAAAVLMQAGLRGDGGSATNSAANIRTVKALLLNGALKPADWTNSPSAPLHPRYGAGVLNLFNSYKQLTGGKRDYIVSTSDSAGNPHPPTDDTGTIGALSGWDFNTNSSSALNDRVNHYYFNVTNGISGANFTATATLVWNRQHNQTGINNLDLFLYDTANSNLVMCSTSAVDNVEHIFVTRLPQGRYDLQVWKAGGVGVVSTSEPYALAFEFFSTPLTLAKSGTNATISWPIYPTGFVLESSTNLASPVVWKTNSSASIVTNNRNNVVLRITNDIRFFRLRRP